MIEVLVAASLTGIVLSASIGSLLFLAKSTKGVGNYQEMNMESRFALEDFGSDARMTAEVNAAGTTALSLDVYDSTGGISRIIYQYNADTMSMTRTVGGISSDPFDTVGANTVDTVLEDVVSLSFIYYDLHGNPTTNVLSVKEVQIQAEMQRNVLKITNTNEIISARFMMRNRAVSS